MKLYGSYTSPYVRHCRIALIENNIPFEFIETDNQKSTEVSPTQRVPLLVDEQRQLTDSSSIVRYIREKSQQTYLANIDEQEQFCLANTLLDTAVNIFMIKKYDGIEINHSAYLTRQSERITTTLIALDKLSFSKYAPANDGEIRLACTLAWAVYRQRFSLAAFPNLIRLLNTCENTPAFKQTCPPETV